MSCNEVSSSKKLEIVDEGEGSDLVKAEEKVDANEFIKVESKRARKGHRKGKSFQVLEHHVTKASAEDILNRPVTENRCDILRKITRCKEHLEESPFFAKFLECLSDGLEIVTGSSSYPDQFHIHCLGLGPFSSHLLTRIARYQLALLVLLQEKLKASVEIYDPVFIPQEKSILMDDFGFTVSETNEEGKHRVDTSTLIFMPHCPHQLMNNFLYANWTPESLSRSFIICNSFNDSLHSISPQYVKENLQLISKAHSICSEITIPNTFIDHTDVFNDLSLHTFPPKNYKNVSENFWLDVSNPVYSERDYISHYENYNS